jgi:hypothetical protein
MILNRSGPVITLKGGTVSIKLKILELFIKTRDKGGIRGKGNPIRETKLIVEFRIRICPPVPKISFKISYRLS